MLITRVCGRNAFRISRSLSTREIKRPPVTKLSPDKEHFFGEFGLAPLLQHNLLNLLESTTEVPRSRIKPSPDQSAIFGIIRANNNLILNGVPQTGKSLALATMAINRALTHAPISKDRRTDTLIIVPTDDLVKKYRLFIEKLVEGFPQECCPYRGDVKSDISYEPLRADFTDSEGSTFSLGDTKIAPHIVVSTPSGYLQLQEKNGWSFFDSTRLILADDLDFLINTIENVELVGKKQRGITKLELFVKGLFRAHFDLHKTRAFERLQRFEANGKELTNYKYAPLILGLPINAKPQDVSLEKDMSSMYLERMMRVKKRIDYRPLQFAFVRQPGNPFMEKCDDSEKATKLVKVLTQLHSKQNQFYSRLRNLVKVDNFDPTSQINLENGSSASSPTVWLGSCKLDEQKPVVGKFESGSHSFSADVVKDSDKFRLASSNDNQKRFLRGKLMIPSNISDENLAVMVDAVVDKFYQASTDTRPCLVIVPLASDTEKITALSKNNYKTKKDILDESPGEYDHIMRNQDHFLLQPQDIVGRSLHTTHNLIIIGLDSLLMALSLQKKSSAAFVAGLVNANQDLLYYYIGKLLSSDQLKRNLVLVEISNTEQDAKKLSMLLLANMVNVNWQVRSF